jgi:hypothetical protein
MGPDSRLGQAFQTIDLTPDATSISIRRGRLENPAARSPDIGEATITTRLKGGTFNLLAARPGRVISIHIGDYNAGGWVPIFTGKITDADLVSSRGYDFITITAADNVAVLQGITRYGAAHPTNLAETIYERIRRLRASSPTDIIWVEPDPAETVTLLCDTVYESSLANHLDLACNSVGGTWWIDTWGDIQFGIPVDSRLNPSMPDWGNSGVGSLDENQCEELTIGYGTGGLTTVLEITNHARKRNDEGAWEADDYTLSAETNSAALGTRKASLDTGLYADSEARLAETMTGLAWEILRKTASLLLRPSTIRFDAVANTDLITADLNWLLRVTQNGRYYELRTTGIEHSITPDEWIITHYVEGWT